MCGACPGGGRLSEGTLYLAQRLSPARTAQLVSDFTGGRLRIAPLGDGWSVSLPTGGMRAIAEFEELARACGPYARSDLLAAARAQLRDREDPAVAFILDYLADHLPDHLAAR